MQHLRDDHRHRSRYDRCRERPGWERDLEPDSASPIEQVATSVGDAVARLIRAFDATQSSAMTASTAFPGRGRAREGGGQRWQRRGERGWRDDERDECDECGHHHHHRSHHHRHHSHHDDYCDDCCYEPDCCPPRCGPDPCHCACCIGDVDVVVYARVGETRVIPIAIENRRSRERDIDVTLSEFTTKGGRPAPVRARLLAPSAFVLAPCSEREVIIAVAVGLPDVSPQPQPQPQPTPGAADRTDATKAELLAEAREAGIPGASSMSKDQLAAALLALPGRLPDGDDDSGRRVPDVDDCLVAVADLRIQGCDTRPLRIAVAILPRDCNRYEVHCGDRCCC
jgi:hypothetical protein